MEHFRQILNRLPPSIGQELAGLPGSVLCSLEEIRLRCGQQVRLETDKGTQRIPHIVTAEELQETLNLVEIRAAVLEIIRFGEKFQVAQD